MKISPCNWRYHFKTPYHHQGALVHKRVFERIGEFSREFKIAMDYDFFYRAISAGTIIQKGEYPIAVMRTGGVGSKAVFTKKRILEEFLVQRCNETSLWWKLVQAVYRLLYLPYKLLVFPILRNLIGTKNENSRPH